jgi:hypothetical protein
MLTSAAFHLQSEADRRSEPVQSLLIKFAFAAVVLPGLIRHEVPVYGGFFPLSL